MSQQHYLPTKEYFICDLKTVHPVNISCVDDWMDEKKLPRKVYGDTLKKKVSKISSMYPEKAEAIKKQMEMLSELENKGETVVVNYR